MPNKPQRIPQPYEPAKLSHLWDTEQISVEEFCRQLNIWNQLLHAQLLSYEREWENVQHQLADLYTRLEEVERKK